MAGQKLLESDTIRHGKFNKIFRCVFVRVLILKGLWWLAGNY